MKEEEQRIAIATAAGWTGIIAEGLNMGPAGIEPGHFKAYMPIPLPDYLNDLNDLHEAEKVLQGMQLRRYSHYVWCIKIGITPYESNDEDKTIDFLQAYHLLQATAKQKSEAFLRAIGKWID